MPKFIEMVLYDGKDAATGKQLIINSGDINEIQSFEEFYESFKKHLDYFMSINRLASDVANSQRAMVVPSIFLSTLSTGCLDAGVPLEAGGGRFIQSVFTLTGGIDAVNCLLAIKNLVFDRKKLTFEQLLEALKSNFEGFEDIHKMCLDAPKYGNDNPEIDAFTRKFYHDVDELHNKYGPDSIGRKTMAEAYSLTYNNYFGSMMEALPNGRKRGFALTDGSVSAMPGTDIEGSTALIKSAANAIDTVRFGSNHLNMKFLPSSLESLNGSRMLLSLVKTYFDLGGYHIQFNCVSADTLKSAKDKPDDYKNLMVRVAGFSAYYTRLDRGVQNEIIKRTEYTEY